MITYGCLGFGRSDPCSERIAALAAGPAIMQLLPGCGHVPHREQGDVVPGLVGNWFAPVGS
mgnify:CR=1 FL=1